MLFVWHKRTQRLATGSVWLLLALILLGLGYVVTSSSGPSAELMTLAHGRNVPDAQFWRPAAVLYQQLAVYGQYGRRLYLTHIAPVDVFIPLAQALFLSVTITLVYRRAFASESRWHRLNLLPFAAMMADYLENASLVLLMLIYPAQWHGPAAAAGLFTAVKFIVSIASIVCIMVGGIIWLGKRYGHMLIGWLRLPAHAHTHNRHIR